MSSSDSDDDCYGNLSKKLQNMKNKYHEDNIDTANLLNTSTEIHNKVQTAVTPAVSCNSETKAIENVTVDDDDMILDQIIALNSIQKQPISGRSASAPKTLAMKSIHGGKVSKRGKNNKSIDTNNVSPVSNPVKNNISSDLNICSISISDSPNGGQTSRTSPVRGQTSGRSQTRDTNPIRAQSRIRARSRARGIARRSGRSRNRPSWASIFYSVGNTDDYPDLSDDVELFTTTTSTTTSPQEVVDDTLDENEELSIKVYWQSSEIIKFTIRKFQKLSQIFEFFSKRENVSKDKLLLTYNDKILKPDDTPDTIGYNIAKFIDGGIVNYVPIVEDAGAEDVNGIKIKFQCQNMKRPLEIVIRQNQRLIQAFLKCAEHMEVPLNKLKFVFDGDCVAGSVTAQDLELEGGECIDVKIIT